MSATELHPVDFRGFLNDMRSTELHLEEIIRRQQTDDRLQSNPHCAALFRRIRSVLHTHVLTLEEQAAAYGPESKRATEEPLPTPPIFVSELEDKTRGQAVSKILRDDQTALNLAATAYSMLHTTGLALDELPLATISLRHLKDITPLVMELGELIPSVVVHELSGGCRQLDPGTAELARENISDAWSESTQGNG